MRIKSSVPIPVKNSVVAGENPVSSGTRKVAPNMATMCCEPIPMVRGQDRRSWGCTTSPGPMDLPSPCSFQVKGPVLSGFPGFLGFLGLPSARSGLGFWAWLGLVGAEFSLTPCSSPEVMSWLKSITQDGQSLIWVLCVVATEFRAGGGWVA